MKRMMFVLTTCLLLLGIGCSGGQEKADEAPTEDDMQQTTEEGEGITEKMAGEHEGDEPKANEGSSMEPAQPVTSKEVSYGMVGDTELTGYMARPDDDTVSYPGLLVIHEWWGLNQNIKNMTERLAGEGYVVLAVDLYDNQVAEEPAQAKKFMQEAMADKDQALENIEAGIAYLKTARSADTLGVIGWCFGGGWTLQTALNFPGDIDAAVMYYGQLVLDKGKLEALDAPLLGIFASEDQAIPPQSVVKFDGMLKELDKTAKIRVFEGVDHAFANPSGKHYDPEAAEDSWELATEWLDEHLSGPTDMEATE
ncbi:MAG: dienelactone hydrolase family protein [Myxococcota bacterium]